MKNKDYYIDKLAWYKVEDDQQANLVYDEDDTVYIKFDVEYNNESTELIIYIKEIDSNNKLGIHSEFKDNSIFKLEVDDVINYFKVDIDNNKLLLAESIRGIYG